MLSSHIFGADFQAPWMWASAARPPPITAGSPTHKQVFLYGVLDTGPTILERNAGMAWGIGGWLVTSFLQKSARKVLSACATASQPT